MKRHLAFHIGLISHLRCAKRRSKTTMRSIFPIVQLATFLAISAYGMPVPEQQNEIQVLEYSTFSRSSGKIAEADLVYL